jgi:hypothetical protein
MDEQEQTSKPQVEEVVPLNIKAILDWCDEFRPELRPVVWDQRNNSGFILMMTIGFEAGRRFQKERPEFPIGAEASPLYLNQAVVLAGDGVKAG